MCIQGCPYVHNENESGPNYCQTHKDNFESSNRSTGIAGDICYGCDNCSKPVLGGECNYCSDCGGVTTTHQMTVDIKKIFDAFISYYLQNVEDDLEQARDYFSEHILPFIEKFTFKRKKLPTIEQVLNVVNVLNGIEIVNKPVTTEKGASTMSSKLSLSTLNSEAREVALRKVTEKLLKSSRKNAPKLLCKAHILPKEYVAVLEALLETPLGESIWNMVIAGLASYAPEIPCKDKYKGLQAQIASEIRKQTMGAGIDQLWKFVEPVVDGFFSDFEKEETKYAALGAQNVRVTAPEIDQAEVVTVGVSPTKTTRSNKSNR